jgi:nifR3 family TIM-barrel protein
LESYLKHIDLPGITIPGNLFLAPLAGYSDAAFRSICIQWGADLCYTEMISAEGIIRNNKKTIELLERSDNERLFAVQIFASSAETASRAVARLTADQPAFQPDLIDLNCGCSVPKVLKSGCGAVLLRSPQLIASIIRSMRETTDRPVTVKLRSGWDHDSINFTSCAEAAERAGAAMICLHPRTRTQGFSGRARLSHLKKLKNSCSVPVIGSGDLFSPAEALTMFRETGCDGLMFARGAFGNPFIFTATKELLRGNPDSTSPSAEQRMQTALQQLQLAISLKGERRACKDMRKHFCHYSKGIRGGAALRARAVQAESFEDYKDLIEGFFENR